MITYANLRINGHKSKFEYTNKLKATNFHFHKMMECLKRATPRTFGHSLMKIRCFQRARTNVNPISGGVCTTGGVCVRHVFLKIGVMSKSHSMDQSKTIMVNHRVGGLSGTHELSRSPNYLVPESSLISTVVEKGSISAHQEK